MPQAAEDTLLRGNKALITVSAMLGGLMAFLDISIVNVGLNDIRANFGTPMDRIAWVATSYAMANVTVIPMSGWLLKRFGFRRYFTASILLFTLASALCGLAWDLPSLVVFRILQGIGGGAIIPTSQSVLLSRYPERQHGTAAALFGLGAITGPLLGPTVGGYIIEAASWHWIFFVNIPFGMLAGYLAWNKIEQPGFVPNREPIDHFGIVLLALGMGTLQYTLEEGNRAGWLDSPVILCTAAIAGISLIGFISHELEVEHPVVELRVFANRAYAAATGLNFLIGTAIFAGSVLLALFCGVIMHYRAIDIGRLFLYGYWIQIFVFPMVGRLVTKVDPRLLLVISNVCIIASLWLNAHLTRDSSMSSMVTPLFVRAIGTGFGFVPLTLLAVSSLPEVQRPGGTALFNLTRELGASVGTAWMVTLLERTTKRDFNALTSHVHNYSAQATEQLNQLQHGPGAALFDPSSAALSVLEKRIHGQALIRAFNSNFLLLAVAFVAASALILLMRRPDPRSAADLKGSH